MKFDVHIVTETTHMTQHDDAVALRLEWEAAQHAAIEDSRRRRHTELQQRDAMEAAAMEIRLQLTGRLSGLLESLEPYVDGTMGEPTAGIIAVYLKAVRELGGLYGLTRSPRPLTAALPLPEPAAVDVRGEEEQRAAVEVLRADGLKQLETARVRLEAGRERLVKQIEG